MASCGPVVIGAIYHPTDVIVSSFSLSEKIHNPEFGENVKSLELYDILVYGLAGINSYN